MSKKGGPKTGGRKKGSLNKATKAFKEFVTGLCEDPDVQEKARETILDGRTELLFKAAEFAFGKPKQEVAVTGRLEWIVLPEGDDVATS